MTGLHKLIFSSIVFIAVFLRVLWLDSAPRGGLIDELHYGYLAHSILETGKDEHGNSFPLLFRGFGDNKLPVGVYALVPFVKLWGLNETVVRMPSVLAGLIVVITSFFLARALGFGHRIALTAMLISAISPWPFILSRFGFESNLALAMLMVALTLMFRGLTRLKIRELLLMTFLLALTWYTYIAYRPITLLLLLVFLGIIWLRKNSSVVKPLLIALGLFGLVILPTFMPTVRGVNTSRFDQIGFTSDTSIVSTINENRTFCDMRLPLPVCSIIWNKPVVTANKIFARILSVFSADYMILSGEGKNNYLSVNEFGLFFWAGYPLLIFGLVAILMQLKDKKSKTKFLHLERSVIIIVGLLIAVLPAVMVGDPQKVRLSAAYPFLLILMLYGILWLINYLTSKRLIQTVVIIVLGVTLWQAAQFYFYYYTVQTQNYDYLYQSYVPEMMRYVASVDEEAQVFIKPFFSDPLMFYAYYTKYDPAEYQQKVVLGELENSGFQHAVELDKIKIENHPAEELRCLALQTAQPTVLITNENFGGFIPAAKFTSANGVHTYAYAYYFDPALINPAECAE